MHFLRFVRKEGQRMVNSMQNFGMKKEIRKLRVVYYFGPNRRHRYDAEQGWKEGTFVEEELQGYENTMEGSGYLDVPMYNLSDFELFFSVMKNKRAHEIILSIILGEDDLELDEIRVEDVILNQKGKRSIRLDAWALDKKKRQFNTEMQGDISSDDIQKRARFYQSMMDTPALKAGKETRYKSLPSTVVIFITQEDLFKKGLAKYTFVEECQELPGLHLEDGTAKIFLNMTIKDGEPALISLLQYMKETTLKNENIVVKDSRIIELDEIVREIKQTEEWEDMKMKVMAFYMERGEYKTLYDLIRDGILTADLAAQRKCLTVEEFWDKVDAFGIRMGHQES